MSYIQEFCYFCNMIELAQHIEVLLLDNDCVIVPGLGGFVTHYIPATRVSEENLFLPPTRIIGFNPRLTMNDGLLAQSYAFVYGTTFPDATKMVERDVKALEEILHEEGKAELPNIGELRCSIHGTYDFVPYDNKITTPCLYGLGSFEIQELSKLKNSEEISKTIPMPQHVTTRKNVRRWEIKLKRSYLSNVIAVIIAIALFSLSAPVENTEIVEENYARFLPEELFERIANQSLTSTPITVSQKNKKGQTNKQNSGNANRKVVKPIAVKEVKVKDAKKVQPTSSTPHTTRPEPQEAPKTNSASATHRYYIIVASVGTEKDAKAMAQQLKQKGFNNAQAVIGDGKMRVSICSCESEEKAYKELNSIRQNEAYQSAWVLKR